MNQALRVLSNSVQISCHVKPNARAGSRILSVENDVVELAVSAKPQDGAANKAVMVLIADVLNVPRTAVSIVRGLKSKGKMIDVPTSLIPGLPTARNQNLSDDAIYALVKEKLLASI